MNWRYRVARELAYVDSGRYLCNLPYQLLLSAGAAKLLWPSLTIWHLLALAVPAIACFNALGRAYRRWGWQQQAASVTTLENMSWAAYVQTCWLTDLLKAHDIPRNHIPPPEEMDPEVRALLMRGHHT